MTEESPATARILAVDDDKGIRDVVTDGLTRAGYRCAWQWTVQRVPRTS